MFSRITSLDACSMGILTLDEVADCLSVKTNRILCGVELTIGVLISCLMIREIKRVSSLMQAMLISYSTMLVSIVVAASLSLADADPTLEAQYVVCSISHIGFAFGVSCRTLVLARVVVLASPRRCCFLSPRFSLVFFPPFSRCLFLSFLPFFSSSLLSLPSSSFLSLYLSLSPDFCCFFFLALPK